MGIVFRRMIEEKDWKCDRLHSAYSFCASAVIDFVLYLFTSIACLFFHVVGRGFALSHSGHGDEVSSGGWCNVIRKE